MAHLSGEELHQRQYDILWDMLSDNPYLSASSIPALHKQLNTRDKNVILAINEILQGLRQNDTTVNTFSKNFNAAVGNLTIEPELLEDLQKIDTNLLKSVYKIYCEIVGDPNNPTDISEVGPSVKAAIKELNVRLNVQEKLLEYTNYIEDLTVNPEDKHSFNLSFIPQIGSLTVDINGVEYYDDYQLDRENKKLIWTFDSNNNGFDILEDFAVKAKYDLYYWENDILDPERFFNYMQENKEWIPGVTLISEEILGVKYNEEFEGYVFLATNGVPPYTFSLESGSLPKGLTLSSAGELRGTPEEFGDFKFVVRVEDSEEGKPTTDSLEFNINVSLADLSLNDEELTTAKNNTPYNYNLTASGGLPPYSFSAKDGTTLPAGLTINSSGLISGRPSENGEFNFDIEIKDSLGNIAVKTVKLIVEVGQVLIDSDSGGTIIDEANNIVKFASLYVNNVVNSIPSVPLNGTGGDLINKPTLFTVGNSDESNSLRLQWFKGEFDSKTVYICDRNLVNGISFNQLDSLGLVTGINVNIDGKDYLLRCIKGGSTAIDKNNEWDSILVDKILDSSLYNHGTTSSPTASLTLEGKMRGRTTNKQWQNVAVKTLSDDSYCWRPVLELIN